MTNKAITNWDVFVLIENTRNELLAIRDMVAGGQDYRRICDKIYQVRQSLIETQDELFSENLFWDMYNKYYHEEE